MILKYFREVTSGQQLDEVDISVHCDIKIFEWLMCWILYDNIEVRYHYLVFTTTFINFYNLMIEEFVGVTIY